MSKKKSASSLISELKRKTIKNYSSEEKIRIIVEGLSKKIYNSEFEKEIAKWEAIDVAILNNAAYELLNENTADLHNEGDDVENFIKNNRD